MVNVWKKVVHWQQVVISACEQSGRCYVPVVKMPQKLAEAQQYNTKGFVLGPCILRTETTALTAISLMQQRWGDL